MLTLTSSKAAKAASKSNTRTKAKTITVEEDNPSQLWTEKYRPKCVADLPVHHSKVCLASFLNQRAHLLKQFWSPRFVLSKTG